MLQMLFKASTNLFMMCLFLAKGMWVILFAFAGLYKWLLFVLVLY